MATLPRDGGAPVIAPYSFGRILVPLDGTKLSEGVFTLVRWLLGRKQADVKLLTVLSRDETWTDDPVELACDYLEWRRQALLEAGARVRYAIRVGDPAEQILAASEDFQPNIIAMATHGRTGINRWRRGSVTEQVLRRATVPVLAVNPGGLQEAEKPRLLHFGRILVPLDGSDRAAEILPAVAELARLYDSVVTLLHVEEPIVVPTMLPANVGDFPRSNGLGPAALEPYREALAAVGVNAIVRTIVGSALAEILRIANEETFDLVALTTHGRTGVARLILGSIAEHVLRHCTVPVLLKRTVPIAVPTAAEEPLVARTSEA